MFRFAATVALASSLCGTAASAQDQDRTMQNREAVRQAFPIVRMFDRKAPKEASRASTGGPQTPGAIGFGNGRFATFDIAGVKLGMDRVAAITAAQARGYVHKANTRSDAEPNFADQVNTRRQQIDNGFQPPRPHYEPGMDLFNGPQGQSLQIHYAHAISGPVVGRVTYSVDRQILSAEAVKRSSIEKYGSPSASSAYGYTLWCAQSCDGETTLPTGFSSITLAAGSSSLPVSLTLFDGNVQQDVLRRRIDEAAAALVGRGAKPAF